MRKVSILMLAVFMFMISVCFSADDPEEENITNKLKGLCLANGGRSDQFCECSARIIQDELTGKEIKALFQGGEILTKIQSPNISSQEREALSQDLSAIKQTLPMSKLSNIDDIVMNECCSGYTLELLFASNNKKLKNSFISFCQADQYTFKCTTTACCECAFYAFVDIFSEEIVEMLLKRTELEKTLQDVPEEIDDTLMHAFSDTSKLMRLTEQLELCNESGGMFKHYDDVQKDAHAAALNGAFAAGVSQAKMKHAEDVINGVDPSQWSWSDNVQVGDYLVRINGICAENGVTVKVLEDPSGPVDPSRYPPTTSFTKTFTVCTGTTLVREKLIEMCEADSKVSDKCCECSADVLLGELTDVEALAMVNSFEMMEKLSSGDFSNDEMAKLMEDFEEIQKNIPMDKLENLDDKIKDKCGEDCI